MPSLRPADLISHSQKTAPLVFASLASSFLTVDPIVKVIKQVAPGVVLQTEDSLYISLLPLREGLWLLTNCPFGVISAVAPLDCDSFCDDGWGCGVFEDDLLLGVGWLTWAVGAGEGFAGIV